MMKGRICDRCGHYLSDDEYDRYGSWNYTCDKCGFRYIHGSTSLDKNIHKNYRW